MPSVLVKWKALGLMIQQSACQQVLHCNAQILNSSNTSDTALVARLQCNKPFRSKVTCTLICLFVSCLSSESVECSLYFETNLHDEPVDSLPSCIEQSRRYKQPPEAGTAITAVVCADWAEQLDVSNGCGRWKMALCKERQSRQQVYKYTAAVTIAKR